jgi:hypothetical protein
MAETKRQLAAKKLNTPYPKKRHGDEKQIPVFRLNAAWESLVSY